MPEATGKTVDGTAGSNGNELGELRELLIGSELSKLDSLEARITEPASRAADLAEVLPDAVRAAKSRALGGALEPIFEKAFSLSVKKKPHELVASINPIILPAIRASIATSIREFAEGLQQIVEKSVSVRAIRWRIESIISGKPFSEILLARSLLYSVDQVFLIHRKSGLLLLNVAQKDAVVKDADMVSGMLTAIRDFVYDSFAEGGQDLQNLDTGRFKLWLTYSPGLLLAGAVSGTAPVELQKVFRKALDGIEQTLQTEIAKFRQDDVSVFEPARPYLEACLLGSAPRANPRKARIWPWVAAAAVVLLVFIAWRVYTQARWNRYFDTLKQQPGLVITGIEKHGSAWVISGFRDTAPDAPDPLRLARDEKLDPASIHLALQPYLSLNTSFAAERARNAVIDRIRTTIVRFDTNASNVSTAQADRIDEITAALGELLRISPKASVELVGHADEIGDANSNDKLSLDRALHVKEALVAQGIPASALSTRGLGNQSPLRAGKTDWDRSSNRAVSFDVTAP